MRRTIIPLLLLAVLLASSAYVSYLIGYRIAPKLNHLGYEPKGLQHHEKINQVRVRDFKHRFYPSRINL